MPNYEDMTAAQLIEIIESLEKAARTSISKPTAEQASMASEPGTHIPFPALIDLDAVFSENSPSLKWLVDLGTCSCLAVNSAALAFFGHSRTEFLALEFPNAFPAGVQPATRPGPVGGRNKEETGTWEYRARDGQMGLLQVCSFEIVSGNRRARLMIAHDVSKQHQTETELKRGQEWMRRSQAYANFGIWDWDIGSDVTHLSGQMAALFGSEGAALESTREALLNAVHEDDRQRVIDVIHACSACKGDSTCGRDGFDIQYRIVKPDGAVRWMHERGGAEHYEDGRPQRMLSVVQDITDQKHSEQARRESEEHFRLFAENIREMIWIACPGLDKLIYVNHACSTIFGVDRSQLQKKLHWRELVHPEDVALVEAALQKQKRGVAAEVEARIVRPDGRLRWVRARSFPMKNGEGERLASGIVEDITDRRQLEDERLAHMMQQRTDLVREVHHRIKNNLQGVAGLLRQQANEHPEVCTIINQAIAQVRTVAVVHGLQGRALDNEVVLCEMVPSIARSVESVLSPRAVLDVRVDVPQRIRVKEQETVPIALILNELIINSAKHAAVGPEAPRIIITVNWDKQRTRAVIGIVNPGMLPEDFDFFSAKGTGTGLDLVRSLLPPVGGKLSFASNDGRVTVLLELSAPTIYNV